MDPTWLRRHLGEPGLKLLDASWFLPAEERDPKREFEERRIPGARFFDIDEISRQNTPLPHMLPDSRDFEDAVRALGVDRGDAVVTYDGLGVFSAPRAWWMFRVFGHDNVAVLDGGFPAWAAGGNPLEHGPAPEVIPGNFSAAFRPELVRSLDEVRGALAQAAAAVVDARGVPRFRGEEPELRPGVRPGHIPGSRNVPYGAITPEGRLAGPDAVRVRFAQAGVDLDRPVITTCGSGISACILALGLYRAGKKDVAVYDGSWTEWGSRPDTAVAVGEDS